MSRYLTTQERVTLAVQAGHCAEVMEHCRIHNNGDGTELETLTLTDEQGVHHAYTRLPSYGVAAVDCYLNMFDIPRTNEVDVNKVVTPKVTAPKASMLSMEHLHYANHCHEQAAYFQQHQGKTLSGTLFERNEFAAIHVAFSMIEEIVIKHPHEIHLATVIHDDVDNVTMLKLSNGRVICRGEAEEARPGVDAYGYFAYEPRDKRSVDDILNLELNELADILHDKGLGLN